MRILASGFGRCGGGEFWATQRGVNGAGEKIVPDIMCIGKALTGGYMSLAAAITTEKVAHGISAGGDVKLPFMHGPTFMGNPLACAVALESTKMLIDQSKGSGQPYWMERVNAIEKQLTSGLESARGAEGVKDVRVQGAIGVIEMLDNVDVGAVSKRCAEEGVWLRPFGKTIYSMIPYIAEEEHVSRVTSAMKLAAAEAGKVG